MNSAEDCAKLILINMEAYNKEKEKNIDNYLISKKTLRIFAYRVHIKESFIKKLRANLFDLGYVFVDLKDDNKYAIISLDNIYNMKTLSSKYAKNRVEDIYDSDDIEYVYDELFNIDDEDVDDDDESEEDDE